MKNGVTSLHLAPIGGWAMVCQYLKVNGAALNAQSIVRERRTRMEVGLTNPMKDGAPFHFAAVGGRIVVCQYLHESRPEASEVSDAAYIFGNVMPLAFISVIG